MPPRREKWTIFPNFSMVDGVFSCHMSKNFFLVEATPANENFHPIYVEAEDEGLARQLFCEYYSIPTSL
jgi:hypothetical protein